MSCPVEALSIRRTERYLERAAAERMKATTVSLDSSHVPMLSQPKAVLDVIRDAANSLE